MTDEGKQLSVAELLARNGQGGSAPASGGGGRRRRGGRGISVAELTGDLPVIGGGQSSHAAPDTDIPDEPVAAAPSFDYSGPDYSVPDYSGSGFAAPEYSAPEPVSYAPPEPAPDLPSYSPMSGPISMYNPLDPSGRSGRVMPGREMPSSRHGAPADPLPDAYAPAPDSYSPDRYAPDPLSGGAAPSIGSGRTGRRHRPEPEDPTTEVRPLRDVRPAPPARAPLPERERGAPALDFSEPKPGSRAARRRAKEAAEEAEAAVDAGPSTAAWAPPAAEFAPESAPLPVAEPRGSRANAPVRPPNPEPPQPDPQRRPAKRGAGDGGLPAWSARRHNSKPAPPPRGEPSPESGGIPTSAWSLASQDQQLLSGQTVAGDLLRDGVERAERADAEREHGRDRGRRDGKRGRSKRDQPRPPVDDFDGLDGRTDVHGPLGMDADDDLDDEPAEHDSGRATATKTAPRRSRAARKAEDDANRRQWMILGGQSAGAAIAGMLLFKGFERMWEMLPWVALTLAMIVILGLVALVRILRRTDDVLSTVIAVVVGTFVTLGPLAFLLSTN
ncbi:hypothetical protein [Nocardia sp. NPDC052566]|uniref:hypothetical protein n=1 Tax=Nocardia sp. NPDC052566 TaxID=3364330 RepID=UPI0037C7CA6D